MMEMFLCKPRCGERSEVGLELDMMWISVLVSGERTVDIDNDLIGD